MLFFLHSQLLKLRHDISSGISGLHLLVDESDFSLRIDVKCPALRKGTGSTDHAVGFGDFFAGVAQDGVIQIQTFREIGVFLSRITACREIDYVEFFQLFATLTE